MRKQGFTLIELLAVITILAIILLIAVPIVLRLTKDSKKSTAKESLEMYGRAIENAVANYFMKNPEEDEVLMEELIEGNYIQYKGTPITCEEVQIYKDNVYLASCKMKEDYIDATYGKHVPETETMLKRNYIGYYADVDGDGNADGVIYADLAHSKEETTWGRLNLDKAKYSYEAKDNLKEYTISENKYTEGKFGEKEIITLKPGSTGNARFYVMALSDFREGSMSGGYYYWYYNATGKMSTWNTDTSVNFGCGKTNTGTIIEIWNAGENGKYGAAQHEYDIWGKIQNKYQEGWYIPSVGEWVAFADYLANREEAPLTSNYNPDANNYTNNGNYDDVYGLSGYYWSSSQYGTSIAWYVTFDDGNMIGNFVSRSLCVRLSATF